MRANLTGKQKRFLRGLGQALDVICIVGKAGLGRTVLDSISVALARRELIKIRLPAGPPTQRRSLGKQIAQNLDAECIAIVGRTVLLYRPSDQLAPDNRINLP